MTRLETIFPLLIVSQVSADDHENTDTCERPCFALAISQKATVRYYPEKVTGWSGSETFREPSPIYGKAKMCCPRSQISLIFKCTQRSETTNDFDPERTQVLITILVKVNHGIHPQKKQIAADKN